VHLRIHVFVKYTNIDKRLVHLTCPFSFSQCCDAVHEDKTRMDHTITKSGSKAGGSSRSGREGFGNTSSTQVNESAEMVVTVRDFARSAQRSAPPATAAPEIAARTPLQDKSNISPNVSPKMQSLKFENEIEALTSSYNKNVLESWQQKKPAATQNAYANIPDNVSAYPAFSNIRNSPDHANHPNNARLFATNSNTSGEPKIKHPTQQNSRTGARWRRSFSSELPRTTGSQPNQGCVASTQLGNNIKTEGRHNVGNTKKNMRKNRTAAPQLQKTQSFGKKGALQSRTIWKKINKIASCGNIIRRKYQTDFGIFFH